MGSVVGFGCQDPTLNSQIMYVSVICEPQSTPQIVMSQWFQTKHKWTENGQSVFDNTAFSWSLHKVLAGPLNSVLRRQKIIAFSGVLGKVSTGRLC